MQKSDKVVRVQSLNDRMALTWTQNKVIFGMTLKKREKVLFFLFFGGEEKKSISGVGWAF